MENVPGTEFYGDSRIGGKASGLVSIIDGLRNRGSDSSFPLHVSVPEFSVITTEFFLDFVQRNDLRRCADGSDPDDRIAMAFMKGEMSPRLTGDLWKFIGKAHEPIAVRSSSLLEDDLKSPLAGIYQTKMIPNNQPSNEIRF
ncbi:MAG: PEP/pyruvate-binding domain-containing protein [Candidatus Aegiribacteria sp.]|nr:PEP/pyruvate-binding domain-containing protein [Candidatus Aegiribacteria sp.]